MLIAHGTLVLVVDGAKMAIFRNRGTDIAPALDEIETDHDYSPRTSVQGSDKPGRSFQSGNVGRSGYGEADLHQADEDRFAIAAVDRLAARAGADTALIVIAPPHTLGVLREHYPAPVRAQIVAEIDKDYAGRPGTDVAAMLATH